MNMLRKVKYLLISFLVIAPCVSLSGSYTGQEFKKPFGLMVEFIREPENTLILDSEPEFSWIIPAEAISQKGYQVIVSSRREFIDSNNGDVWNSGLVISENSSGVSYGGAALTENRKYFWKVRIQDRSGRLTEYSEVQIFRTGRFGDVITTPNVFQVEWINPVSVKKTADGNTLFDFGKDAFGTIQLTYKTEKTDTLIISLGEKLLNGKLDRNPGGTIRYAETKLAVKPGQQNYILKLQPDKRNTTGAAVLLPDSLGVVIPFRYAEIKNADKQISKEDIKQVALFHYFDEKESMFSSSDTILNQIWDLCKYSMKATSFTGIYIDGDRERIAYEADAYINQLGHYSVDREYAMAKRTIEHFMSNPTWPTEWLLHTAMMAYQDYLYTGDTEILEKYYTQLKNKSLFELAREDGLISSQIRSVNGAYMKKLGFRDTSNRIRDIVDWPPAQKDTGWKLATAEGERDGHVMLPINTVVNCLFYNNMKIMAEIAGVLNNHDDQRYFENMAAKVRTAINTKLIDPEKGIYIDGEGSKHSSIHSNMMALAFGLVPEGNKTRVVDFVKSRGMACSVYGAQFLMEGLYLAGEGQYALDLMRSTGDRSWWNMIRSGSTITLEAWDMKFKPNSDWNHAWGAAPANIIPRYLWGIKPKAAGFTEVSVTPQMGNLTFSKIEIPTIRGQIIGEYNVVNEKLKTYLIELPANMKGVFSVGLTESETIFMNGKKVKSSANSLLLNPGVNRIEIRALKSKS
ncbi:MAG: family 78 glycoside hydrolase catalytic domain [Bacteroidales bacterium]|nr:family 78 glycoside hydrolase catalytic domain [Bacteroidales bacterium]